MSVAEQVARKLDRGFDPEKPRKPRFAGKALECLLCEKRYSQEDVRTGLYQISTLICSKCYARMQNMPYARSCFGKGSVIENGRRTQFGNDPGAKECQSICPDRFICRRLVWPDDWPKRIVS